MTCAKHTAKLLSGLLVGIALISAGTGCGSKGGSLGKVDSVPGKTTDKAATGVASFTIQWPDRSRLIPAAANSIKITLAGGPVPVQPKVVTRPATGAGSSTVRFEAVPVGSYNVTVAAMPNTDGTGTAQASATSVVKIQSNATATTQLALASTIKKLQVNLASGKGSLNPTTRVLKFRKTEPVTLSVAAQDANGSLVLTANKWKWTTSNPNVAALTVNGGTVTLTGNNNGTSTVTVTDMESSQTVSWTVNVLNAREDLITGKVAWRFPLSSTHLVLATPKVGPDGTVYVLEDGRTLHAINPDGTERWQGPAAPTNPSVDVAVSPDNTVYLLTNHAVEAYTAAGTLKWHYDFVVPADYSYRAFNMVLRPGGGIAISLIRMSLNFEFTYSVLGIDAIGGFLWETPVGSMDESLGLGSDYRKVFTDGTNLYTLSQTNPQAFSSLNPKDGSINWEIPMDFNLQMSVAPDGHLYILNGRSVIGGDDLSQSYISLTPDGKKVWEKTGFFNWAWGSALYAAPNNILYFGSSEGAHAIESRRYLNAYNPDGSLKWQVPTDSRVYDVLQSSAESTILYTWSINYVAALNLDGKELWRIPIIQSVVSHGPSLALSPDNGTLYVLDFMSAVDPNDQRECIMAIQ